ncbi:hypothetical protein DM860_009324 [Cuscuta australis]|uniref:O-fucosyltransferase family protein n=1 Tax=Cuscuta australis TaxID=267555 RepID=A0A328DAI9_9ASTE|nr:hypothetical protein DM860_009324 [Cuscuta australis]
MAVRNKNSKSPSSSSSSSSSFFIALNPSFFSHLLSISLLNSLQFTPKKATSRRSRCFSVTFVFFLVSAAFFSISILTFAALWQSSDPCSAIRPSPLFPPEQTLMAVSGATAVEPLLLRREVVSGNISDEERDFWKQPDGKGYRPCLHFSDQYKKASPAIAGERRRFLVVVVSGGLNQQRNQIVDAVVIARILEAALVVPVLQINRIWKDESEFSEIFDVDHFKNVLKSDVRIVSSLPSSHLVSKQTVENRIPFHVSPLWLRAKFFKRLNQEGLLILKGLDSKLSKNLPSDLQKLRCKVAFHALRFAGPVRDISHRFARRMWAEGPYVAVHLRLEKDVWVRSGCSAGLGAEHDGTIGREREAHPELLTGKVNATSAARRAAGLCPLNARETGRLLRALGAPRDGRVYVAGGEPFGGGMAVEGLREAFPNLVTKQGLAREGELEPYLDRASVLAAIDYVVSLYSDVLLTSHGGNMARALEGHRAFMGHKKYIKPNKRMMFPYLDDASISDRDFATAMRKLHQKCQGQPVTDHLDRDVLASPVPHCMCTT